MLVLQLNYFKYNSKKIISQVNFSKILKMTSSYSRAIFSYREENKLFNTFNYKINNTVKESIIGKKLAFKVIVISWTEFFSEKYLVKNLKWMPN